MTAYTLAQMLLEHPNCIVIGMTEESISGGTDFEYNFYEDIEISLSGNKEKLYIELK